MHTGFVQVGLKPGHRIGSYEYIRQIKKRVGAGNAGDHALLSRPAAWWTRWSAWARRRRSTCRWSAANLDADNRDRPGYRRASCANRAISPMCSCRRISIIRRCASISTACTPPNWADGTGGADQRHHLADLESDDRAESLDRSAQRQQLFPDGAISRRRRSAPSRICESIPLHADGVAQPTRLDMIANIERIKAPTEVDHYQIRRKLDIYVRPATRESWRRRRLCSQRDCAPEIPANVNVAVRGSAEAMNASFRELRHRPDAVGGPAVPDSGGAVPLVHRSVHHSAGAAAGDLRRAARRLVFTGTTLNVMSLMGVVMLAGIAMSNSILIVEFAHHLQMEGRGVGRSGHRILPRAAAADPDDLAGHDHRPAADGPEARRRQRIVCAAGPRPDRRLLVSVVFTVFLVPAGFSLAYRSLSAR